MSRLSTILAFVLLAAVGAVMLFFLRPENYAATDGAASSPDMPDGVKPAIVSRIHDGDTLVLDTPDDPELTVRLLAVDTPEVGENAECYGEQATSYLKLLAPEGSTVYTLADEEPFDQYGRSLLFIWTRSGTLVNLSLVADGYAEAVFIGDNRLYESEFEAAEAEARSSETGIWGAC